MNKVHVKTGDNVMVISGKDAGKTGTGLGLSITKAILQQHGFAFGVQSEVGKGSVFWFEAKAPGPQAP